MYYLLLIVIITNIISSIELVVPRPVLMSFMSLGNRTYDSIFGRESMLEPQNPYIGTKWAKKDATVYVRV